MFIPFYSIANWSHYPRFIIDSPKSSNAIIWMKKKKVKNNAVSCFLNFFSKCLLRHLSNYDRTLDSHGTQKVHHVNLKAIKGETKKKNSKIQKART